MVVRDALTCDCNPIQTTLNPPNKPQINMSSTEAGGRQSPKPEDQSHAQVGQAADGQGTDKSDNKQDSNKSDLDVSAV